MGLVKTNLEILKENMIKSLSGNEKMDVHEFFQRTYKYKRDTSFIKWAMLSW